MFGFWHSWHWRNSNVIITNANCDTHKISPASSISSVSKIECKSRIKSLDYGNLIEIKYGKVISKTKVASNYGTEIIVKDIFKNIRGNEILMDINNSKILYRDRTQSGAVSITVPSRSNKTNFGLRLFSIH